jgi:general secretion pathway protein L
MTCAYALAGSGDRVEREGVASLSELSETLAKADRVVLLAAASDVTLLRLAVPPLSGARLKAALPSVVEERLIGDPAECVIVAGAASEGLRTIAVMQRAWLETVVNAVRACGARGIAVLPAQLCLPLHDGAPSAALEQDEGGIELTLRLSEHAGIGLPVAPDATPGEVLQTLCAVVPEGPLTLHVPDALLAGCEEAVAAVPDLQARISVTRSAWPLWLAGAGQAGLDLAGGLGGAQGGKVEWRRWRWPMALAAGVVAANLVGVTIDWWRMKLEANTLRTGMVQTFKSVFPKESVVLDPAAQMRQKIAAAQRAGGQLAPDDFLSLAAGLAEAWGVAGGAAPKPGALAIATLEYRERSLIVHTKGDAGDLAERLKPGLSARGLALTQPAAETWQIRSGK